MLPKSGNNSPSLNKTLLPFRHFPYLLQHSNIERSFDRTCLNTITMVMTIMIRRSIVLFLFITAAVISASAQERIIREQTGPSPISLEAYAVPGDTSSIAYIPLRIRFDFFIFTRNERMNGSAYAAEGELSIEILDSAGNSIARKIKQIGLTSEDNSTSILRDRFYQDLFSFRLPVGRYSIMLLVTDKGSNRRYTDTKRTFVVKDMAGYRSELIPVQSSADSGFALFNLGGDVVFSKDYGFIFVTTKPYESASFTLSKLHPDDEEKVSIAERQQVTLDRRSHMTVRAELSIGHIAMSVVPRTGSYVHYVKFEGSQLRQGRYELNIVLPDSSVITTTFSARWLDMPMSLLDLDAATEPIQFIARKDEYSELRKGSRNTRINSFEEFWKKKDPTPQTAYNEVMHEFYRRVDFSITAFRTLKEMNGAVTDRGKIYILFGKPSSMERLLSPSGSPREIWQYAALKKTFTFEDPSKQGNYKLTENK